MTRDEYNEMDVVKAITAWNEENKLNDDDDFNDDYAYISWCGLFSFCESDDDLAPWNYFSKDE